MIKKYIKYCIDCNKELNEYAYWNGQIRCRSCACKLRLKDPKKNPMYGTHRFGIKNPNFKTGKYSTSNYIICGTCGKKIGNGTKTILCQSCLNKHALKDGHTTYQHYCIDCKKECSVGATRCKKCAEINLPKSLKKIKYKGIWMRSSWEVAYAKYLTKNKTKWEYESKTFDLGKYRYIPDFYLLDSDTYVEIKGRWFPGMKNKFRLFQKKYCSINIILLTGKELKKLKIIK